MTPNQPALPFDIPAEPAAPVAAPRRLRPVNSQIIAARCPFCNAEQRQSTFWDDAPTHPGSYTEVGQYVWRVECLAGCSQKGDGK